MINIQKYSDQEEFIMGYKGGFLSGSEFREKVLNEIERMGIDEGKTVGRRLHDQDEETKEF